MNKLFQTLLLGSAIALGTLPAFSADRDHGLSVSLGGIDANVDVGGRKGLDADVDVSVGDRNGLDADADVSLGGNKGVDADVDVSLGSSEGLDADVNAAIGNGVDAGVNASVGDGLDAGLGAAIGNGGDADVGLPVGDADANLGGTKPASNANLHPDDKSDRPRLTSAQRQAFSSMSATDKAALLKRCGSVSAGGYDPALVELCKLLRMSAAR